MVWKSHWVYFQVTFRCIFSCLVRSLFMKKSFWHVSQINFLVVSCFMAWMSWSLEKGNFFVAVGTHIFEFLMSIGMVLQWAWHVDTKPTLITLHWFMLFSIMFVKFHPGGELHVTQFAQVTPFLFLCTGEEGLFTPKVLVQNWPLGTGSANGVSGCNSSASGISWLLWVGVTRIVLSLSVSELVSDGELDSHFNFSCMTG